MLPLFIVSPPLDLQFRGVCLKPLAIVTEFCPGGDLLRLIKRAGAVQRQREGRRLKTSGDDANDDLEGETLSAPARCFVDSWERRLEVSAWLLG